MTWESQILVEGIDAQYLEDRNAEDGPTNAVVSLGEELQPQEHLNSCLVYIDDVIIFGRTFDDHLHRLYLVLTRIQDAHLTLNVPKCKFAMQRLEHLGHIISQDGIQPNPVKVAAVQGIQPPTTIKDLQRFLGLTGWFRRFIKDYASIAAPLYELTKRRLHLHGLIRVNLRSMS